MLQLALELYIDLKGCLLHLVTLFVELSRLLRSRINVHGVHESGRNDPLSESKLLSSVGITPEELVGVTRTIAEPTR